MSIIVPVYNVANYLSSCIDSLLNQTYTNIEIILVDDGSTDGSGEICDEYAGWDDRIQVIHKQNGGISSARNAGLQKVTGEYIGFIDADDMILPDMYTDMIRVMETENTDLVICNYQTISPLRTETPEISEKGLLAIRSHSLIFMNLYHNMLMNSVCNKLFLKEKISEPFRNDIKVGEDLFFVLAYLKNCSRIFLLGNVYYYYYVREGSTTNSFQPDRINTISIIYKALTRFLSEYFTDLNWKRLLLRFHVKEIDNMFSSLFSTNLSSEQKLRQIEQWSNCGDINKFLNCDLKVLKKRHQWILHKKFRRLYYYYNIKTLARRTAKKLLKGFRNHGTAH